jgi:RHS repeat-associated protein
MPWLRHLACSIYFLAAFFEAAAARPMGLGPMQDERVASDACGTLLADRVVANLATPYGVRAQRLSQSAVLDYVERGYDADLGTVRFGVRDYDPLLGQFWSPDPLLLESLDPCAASPVQCNLYGYAKGNPISFHDPTGTFAWFVPLVVVALLEFEGAANAPGVDTPSEAILRSPSTGDLAISAAKMVVVGASAGAAAGWVAGAGAVAAGAAAGATGSVTARAWDDVSRGEFSGVGTYAKDSVFGAVFGGALGAVARGPHPRGSPVAEPPSGVVAARGIGSVPGRVLSRINVSNSGLAHTVGNHLNPAKVMSKSQFTLSADGVKALLQAKSTVQTPAVALQSGNFARTVTAEGIVGNLPGKLGGGPTNVFTVITDTFGNLQTAFPGTLVP